MSTEIGLGFSKAFYSAKQIARGDVPNECLVAALERYWQSLRRGRLMPSRADIDPVNIDVDLLPFLFLLDVVRGDDGIDYFYRLVGTANVDLVGRDPTGKLMSEVMGSEERRFIMETFDQTVQERAPTYWLAEVPQDRYGLVRVYRGLFPLSSDGEYVDKLICAAEATRT